MQQKNNSALIGIIAVVIIGALVAGTVVFKPKDSATSSTSNSGSSETVTSTPANTNFKDGTYTATGSYSSPGGNEEIEITITLANNTISATSAKPMAASRESSEYQDEFVSTYQDQVVGKRVATLRLGNVSGSSLTSRGFNDALEIIKSQAKI